MSSEQNSKTERRLLRMSMLVTIFFSMTDIGFGLWTGSRSITLDGFYSLGDLVMTGLALLIAGLIARGDDDHFQFGYWHLEPILALANGLMLTVTCAYALADGIDGLLTGGRTVAFDIGAAYTGAVTLAIFAMHRFVSRPARAIGSELLKLDARAWLVGGGLSAALCVSFLVGGLLSGTAWAEYAPYVDPLALAVMATFLLPFPLATIWQAARDIMVIAPAGVARDARKAAETIAHRHGFSDVAVHVARAGRQHFVEVGLVAPSVSVRKSFGELDEIRSEIAQAMSRLAPGCWLTVDFTADKRWI